jgi:hypothetical protein
MLALTLNRSDAFPSNRHMLAGSLKTIGELSEASFPFVILIIIASISFSLLFVTQIYRKIFIRKDAKQLTMAGDNFDYLSGGLFIAVMFVFFLYTANAAINVTPEAELGVHLRNMSPTVLFVPFMILYCYRLVRTRIASNQKVFRVAQVGFALFGVLILWTGLRSHFGLRQQIIDEHAARIAATKQKMSGMFQPPSRIAFWTEASQDFLGEMSFHYWGNYRYGKDFFDKRLIEQFPNYTLFRLRSVGRQYEEVLKSQRPENSGKSKYGKVGDLYWQAKGWIVNKVPPSYISDDGIVTGEQYGVQVSTIAYPESEIDEAHSMTESQLLALINDKFGLIRVQDQSIGDVNWVIISTAN